MEQQQQLHLSVVTSTSILVQQVMFGKYLH